MIEALALIFYQQLIAEINNYQTYELFHNNICPSNTLIYNNVETSGEFKVFNLIANVCNSSSSMMRLVFIL